jgi:hypothetical protein
MRKTNELWSEAQSFIYDPDLISGPWNPPGQLGTVTVANNPVRNRFETIESGSGFQNWNGCEHYKLTRTEVPGPLTYASSNRHDGSGPYFKYTVSNKPYLWGEFGGGGVGSTIGSWDTPFVGLPVLYDLGRDEASLPSAIRLSDLVDSSLQAMLPMIRPKLSIINSILELRDFKSLPRTIDKVEIALKGFSLTNLRYYFQSLKRRRLGGIPGSLRRILHAGADGYLQTQFNLSPLLSDIAGIYRAVFGIAKEIKRLLDDEGKPQIRHYKRSLAGELPAVNTELTIPSASYYGGAIDGDIKYYRQALYRAPVFHAQVEYDYSLTRLQRENALLLGLLDGLGVSLNPQIIWNAIPWSFVIDWVADVSRWLGQFNAQSLGPTTRIRRYLYSVRVERDIILSLNIGIGSPYASSGKVDVCHLNEILYFRVPSRVDVLRSLRTTGLDLKEFSLGAALAVSR